MFENEIAINRMQLAYLDKIVADLPADQHYTPAPGHGHSPAWVLGHLAITGEMGCSLLGGSIAHPQWLPVFGPGSAGVVEADDQFSAPAMQATLHAAYDELQRLSASADAGLLSKPHGVERFTGTPIQTVGHCVALLLTNHFAFHLSQLSSCRRSAGLKAFF